MTQRLLHELRVHQIELEMQNEELQRVQVELEASRMRYFDLYDLAPVGYCIVSEHGLILQANLHAATLLGVSRKVLVKQPISQYIFKSDQDTYYLCRKQLLATGQAQTCELRMAKSDGSRCWLQVTLSAAQGVGGEPTMRMVLTDIGARKELELKLNSALALREKANHAKSSFLSGISHELRTPLNAILGFAQLMESADPPPTSSEKRNIDQILRAGWHLLKLIEEILDLGQIDAGKLSLSLEPVSLAEAMDECRTMIEPQAQQRRIHMLFPQADTAYVVIADRTRMKQVFINILSNAIKYNKVAGTLVVSFAVTAHRRIRVCIEDTGDGLSSEQVAKLFQPFNRLGQGASATQGTGLGLVMTKRLIEMMGGRIGVQSTPGKGSVFWVELNLREGDPL
ncbi:PAS domain-containing sensor histidine kinase [Paralcaligenes ureilyticus]|uniref:histidine kinase n=1 Tax=Paralcaligenes ureilyticus TaxID=627131 RepID=A0A4V2UZ70_9BURK|nr:PAS domain-containing sensor histidine kinase [Paralcaligenes ureilyticus]TCT10148.1 PAS domain S-box-containing protein [Paralcaligenes ureilyticus]